MPRRRCRSRAYQLAAEPESERRMASSRQPRRQLPEHALRVDRVGVLHRPRAPSPSTSRRTLPSMPTRARSGPALRSSSGSSARSVSTLSPTRFTSIGIADARACVRSMSICTPRAWPSLGRNSEYGKLEPIISSVSHSVIISPARLGAQQADRAGHVRQIVRQNSFAEQRLGHAGAEHVGHLHDLVGALAARPRRPASPPSLPRSEPSAARCSSSSFGTTLGRGVADARVDRAMLARRLLDGRLVLEVVGNDDAGHRPLGMGDANRAIDEMPDLRGHRSPCARIRAATSLNSVIRSTSCW